MKSIVFSVVMFCCISKIATDDNEMKTQGFGDTAKIVIEVGSNLALESPLVPMPAKVIVGATKSVVEGIKKYNETGSIIEAGKAAAGSGLDSAEKALKSSPVGLVKTGAGLVKDVYDGKDPKSAIIDRSKEALDNVSGGPAVKVGLEVGHGLAKGDTPKNIALKGGKAVLDNYIDDNTYIENGKKVLDLIPENAKKVLESAPPGLVKTGAGLVKDVYDGKDPTSAVVDRSKEVLDNVPGGKAVKIGVEVGQGLANGDSPTNIALNSGKSILGNYTGDNSLIENGKKALDVIPEEAKKALESSPDLIKTGAGLVKDVYDGKDPKAAIIDRSKEVLDKVPGGESVKIGLEVGQGLANGDTPTNIVLDRGQAILGNYTEDNSYVKNGKKVLDMISEG